MVAPVGVASLQNEELQKEALAPVQTQLTQTIPLIQTLPSSTSHVQDQLLPQPVSLPLPLPQAHPHPQPQPQPPTFNIVQR